MAYVKVRGLYLPANDLFTSSGLPSVAATALDAAADRWALVFRCPKAGVLDHTRFILGAVTKDATTTLRGSFQTVGVTDGNPDGIEDEYRSIPNGAIVANDWVTTGKLTSDGTDGGTPRTVAMGELLAFVVRIETFVAGDNIGINSIVASTRQYGTYLSYVDENTGGSYAKSSTKIGMLTLFYSDGSVEEVEGIYPPMKFGSVTYANNTTPDEYGLRHLFPFPSKASAAWGGVDLDGDTDLISYNAAGLTNLGSLDKDTRNTTLSQAGGLPFNAEVELTKDTAYVTALRPTSTTAIILAYADVAAQVDWDAWGGQELYWAQAKDPTVYGDFTLTTTRRPMMGLKLSALSDGVGGGGSGGDQWFGG